MEDQFICPCGSLEGTNLDCVICREYNSQYAASEWIHGIMFAANIVRLFRQFEVAPFPDETIPFRYHHKVLTYRDIPTTYNTECSICLDEFKPDDQVIHTSCQHTFHSSCIGERCLAQCPNCRTSVSE